MNNIIALSLFFKFHQLFDDTEKSYAFIELNVPNYLFSLKWYTSQYTTDIKFTAYSDRVYLLAVSKQLSINNTDMIQLIELINQSVSDDTRANFTKLYILYFNHCTEMNLESGTIQDSYNSSQPIYF